MRWFDSPDRVQKEYANEEDFLRVCMSAEDFEVDTSRAPCKTLPYPALLPSCYESRQDIRYRLSH
jgi:hypothetical protein